MYMVQERKLGSYIFLAARIAAEVLGVLGGQERALVVVEPPVEMRIGGVFEVHDGVHIAVEHTGFKELRGLVGKARILEAGVRDGTWLRGSG